MIKLSFKTSFAERIFHLKYAQGQNDTWPALCERVVEDVCGTRWGKDRALMSTGDRKQLQEYMERMAFIPGGRYLYYCGREFSAWNNCYLLRAEEDTREEWAGVAYRAMSCLSSGGGIGVDYSILRASGKPLRRTGGIASGPIPLMQAVNEIGRNVMQGGSRRSAIYASLNWQHEDIPMFLVAKNWSKVITDLKATDFNFPAPLDMTNISVNYDTAWLERSKRNDLERIEDRLSDTFLLNCKQAMATGEPGFSFNFGDKENETLRNAPVSGSTRVLLNTGYESVENIVGKEVTIWTGKQWAKTTFKMTGKNIPTLEVCLSNGRSICCDPTHPFIAWNKEGIKRIAAKDLIVGQAIVSTLPQDEISLANEAFYGEGFVFGDGSIRNFRGELSYHTETKREAFEFACVTLGARCRSLENRAYFVSRTSSKIFVKDPYFVAGWFDADGCYTRDLLRLSCKDEGNLFELQEYLDTLGIKTSVRQDGCSGFNPENNCYTLTVYKESHNRFKELIPTIRLKLNKINSVRTQNILVTSVGSTSRQENVYCCDVGVEEHSFMGEGIVISNCTEVTSEDDSDVCNLGSVNLGNIATLEEFRSVVHLASKFLVCGTLRADLPYDKVYEVREKNRRLGLGLMGIHEWLLRRGNKYEVTPELHQWLGVYKDESERAAKEHCDRLYLSHPVAFRAIAPTGSIGILASTTTGIEPLFAVAYKRRYLTDGTHWKYEYVVDATADRLIKEYSCSADSIDTAYKLSHDYERRLKFQADVQDYVDMSISSTINLPPWKSKDNNEEKVQDFATTLARYAPRLRGFTAYPDGSRGGQPLTEVPYEEAIHHKGMVFEESDICEISGKGGTCGG